MLRGGEGLDGEAGGVAHDDEPDEAVLLFDYLEGVAFRPGGVELLGGYAIIVQAAEGRQALPVVFAPGRGLRDLMQERVAPGEQVLQGRIRSGLGAGDVAAHGLDVVQQGLGIAVHGLGRARDIDHAQFLQPGQEVLLVSVQEQEGVLGHLCNHRPASSSSA